MSIKAMVEAAVKPVVPEIAQGEYTGEGDVFCVWDATETPICFGDNRSSGTRYMVQLNLVLPFYDDPQPLVSRLKAAISGEDLFSVPTVEPVEADEQEGYRSFAFEFEAVSREGF